MSEHSRKEKKALKRGAAKMRVYLKSQNIVSLFRKARFFRNYNNYELHELDIFQKLSFAKAQKNSTVRHSNYNWSLVPLFLIKYLYFKTWI